MDLKPIVTEICGEADDFLEGVTKRDEAKAGIAELLTIRYVTLPPGDKKTITEQVMRILDAENFFTKDAGAGD
jgi:hypothetical protein